MLKLKQTLQKYSLLWYNPDICIGKKSVYWRQWHSKGLSTISDQFEEGVFLSYNQLMLKFHLEGKENFWKFLQIRSCITSKSHSVTGNMV